MAPTSLLVPLLFAAAASAVDLAHDPLSALLALAGDAAAPRPESLFDAAPPEHWCADGRQTLPFASDSNVSVYFVQAPLFSTNPRIGGLMGLFDLYHTAIVLAQGEGAARRNWTIEFDATSNVLSASIPEIVGSPPYDLVFNNDARYCLTDGILHGTGHWAKQFELLVTLTPAQANETINTFLPSVNNSRHLEKPVYSLFQVREHGKDGKVLLSDLTCGDGVKWFLHYIESTLRIPMPIGFAVKYTSVVVNAESVRAANTSDPAQWEGIVSQYRHIRDFVGGGNHPPNAFLRVLAFFQSFPCRWLWDGNSNSYYEIVGNQFPWLLPTYPIVTLSGPPGIQSRSGAIGNVDVIV